MAQVKDGDTVQVHYTGKLEDGTVFDTSREGEPLEFKMGDQSLIAGFEDAVKGMGVGDSKTVEIAPDEAYGQYNEEMVVQIGRDQVPDNITPEVGMMLQVQTADGQMVQVRVKEMDEEKLTLDANHPLAGEKLIFDLEVVGVAD